MLSAPLSLRFDPLPEGRAFAFADRAEAELLLALLNRAFLSSDLTEEQKDKLSFFCDAFQAFCLSL
jgi:hypothetical protein